MKPLFDSVLVKTEKTTKSKGGILIQRAVENYLMGTVVALGEGQWMHDHWYQPLKEGDKVYLGHMGAPLIEEEDVQYHIVKLAQIIGIEEVNDE